MLKLLKISEGMGLTAEQIKAKMLEICPVCATSRAIYRIPRDPARRHYTRLGDMLIIDLWGPYPIPGLHGERYVLFTTDDATRFTWEDFLVTKDNLSAVIIRRIKNIKTTYTPEAETRRIRADNGIVVKAIQDVAEEQGFTLEPSVPHAHHHAGTAERGMRTIRERGAAMIQDASPVGRITSLLTGRSEELLRNATLPEALWTEAMREAVWKKNRSPTKALKFKKTPFEAVHGIKPDLTRELPWAARVYVTHPPEHRIAASFTKLHTPRGWLGYYVSAISEELRLSRALGNSKSRLKNV
jgi:hypothetical protein